MLGAGVTTSVGRRLGTGRTIIVCHLLTTASVVAGVALGPIMVAGSATGKRIVDRLPERVFVAVIEATMIAAGLLFLIRG